MRDTLIKICVGLLSFFLSILLFSSLLNKGATDMTIDFPESSYPIVSFLSGDQVYNPTYGYHVRQNPALMKENLTPLGENRSLSFEIQCFHKTVSGISLEVRTVDGSRLIEDSEVKDFEKTGDVISVYTSLKDLLKNGCEYALTVRLDVEGEELYYNTRVVPKEEVDVKTYLDFTKDFTYRTFGEKEEYTELKKYLESNSSEDNADFGYANIHSSLEQVTWGTLAVNPESDIYARLLTIEKDSATVIQYYIVQIGEGKSAEHYRIEEYFRVRRGSERMHLIDYERSMSRLIFEEDEIFFNNTLFLGIDDGSLNMKESPEGTILAFVKDESLFVSNPSENKFAKAFSYYNKENYKDRPFLNRSEIQILSVEEDGKTTFASYGYMTRGSHEGETGLLIYVFDFEKNTLEEKLFVPYSGSPEMLHSNLSKLLYLNAAGSLFFFLDGGIYCVDLESLEIDEIATNLTPKAFSINETGTMAAWMTEGVELGAKVIELENFETMNRFEIKADSGELLRQLGFMGTDLVYGIAYEEDVSVDPYGNVFFPMHSVRIQTEDGTIHKDYSPDGYYVTDCIFEDNMISLVRVKKSEEGNFVEGTGDSIVDNTPEKSGKNTLESVITENYKTVWQIHMTKEFDSRTLQIMIPKLTLFEGMRELEIDSSDVLNFFYTYAKGTITGVWENEADAVRSAYEENGFVLNAASEYIWEKKSYQVKNQIMAIKENTVPENSTSLAVCLECMMQLEGFSQDADAMLARGLSASEILDKYMMDRIALNLSGCPLDIVYYYLDQDIPVLVQTGEESAILLTGYNSNEFVWMEPDEGTLHKVSRETSENYFKERKNRFITFSRKAD